MRSGDDMATNQATLREVTPIVSRDGNTATSWRPHTHSFCGTSSRTPRGTLPPPNTRGARPCSLERNILALSGDPGDVSLCSPRPEDKLCLRTTGIPRLSMQGLISHWTPCTTPNSHLRLTGHSTTAALPSMVQNGVARPHPLVVIGTDHA